MNYKEEVLKFYPDARAEQDNRGFWHIVNNGIPISAFAHEQYYAWEHAILTIHIPVPTPTTITVTGCGDCPMFEDLGNMEWCNHPNHENIGNSVFTTCPLKQNSITIKLNQ